MVRGIITFVCKDCGHKFNGLDIEDNATINSMPVKCPKCGSMHTKGCVPFACVDPAPDPFEPLRDKVIRLLRKIKSR